MERGTRSLVVFGSFSLCSHVGLQQGDYSTGTIVSVRYMIQHGIGTGTGTGNVRVPYRCPNFYWWNLFWSTSTQPMATECVKVFPLEVT